MGSNLKCAGAVVVALGMVLTVPARADDGNKPTGDAKVKPDEAKAKKEADSIIVTGQRASELESETDTGSRLGLTELETPASVSVVEGDDIRARGDMSVTAAVTRATGVTTAANPGNGDTALAMRGFAGQDSVLQLYDGVRLFPVAGTITFPNDPWNIQRIEVLSGPASVLYGQGAMGGAINIIPKQPNTQRFEFEGEAGYGSQNTWHLAGGAGGPISQTLSFRADASYRQSDGYVDRGDSDSLALSGALRFAPSSDFTLTLRDDFGSYHPMKYFGTPLIDGKLDTSIRHNNYNVADAHIFFRDNRLGLDADWTVSSALQFRNTAYYIDSHRRWRDLESYCWIAPDGVCPNDYGGGTPGLIWRGDNYGIVHNQKQYGDEATLKLSSPLGGTAKNDLVVGVDLSRTKLIYSHDFDSDYQEDNVPIDGFDPGLFLDTTGVKPHYRTSVDTIALFGEDRLAINDKLSLVGGIRYEHNKAGRWNYVYDSTGTTIIGETPALDGGTRAYKKLEATTWRVGAVYQPTANLSLYAQYATGVDPLGSIATYSTSASQFQLTYATGHQVEAGVKGVFLDGKGQFTLAAYRLVKNNLFTQQVPSGPIEQVGQRSAKGIEASLEFSLPAGFAINANGTILNANYDDYVIVNDPSDPSQNTVYTGNTPPGVPEQAANLELSWTSQIGLQLRGDLRYVGRRFSDDANAFRVPAYTVVDLGATYALTKNVGLVVTLYNVFDKAYAEATYNDQQWILGRPRSVDVSIRANF
jgi:iron complex outermembrane receptor protein